MKYKNVIHCVWLVKWMDVHLQDLHFTNVCDSLKWNFSMLSQWHHNIQYGNNFV